MQVVEILEDNYDLIAADMKRIEAAASTTTLWNLQVD